MSKTGSSTIALFAGMMVGAFIGILYAPDKGINTRDRFAYRLEKYRMKLEELLADIGRTRDSMPHSAARTSSEKVINDAREKAQQLLQDVDDLLNQINRETPEK